MEGLSHRIKQKRNELDLTQAQLAEMIGVKQQSIQLIESGKTQRPRFLLELATALKCDASWLLFGKKGHRAA